MQYPTIENRDWKNEWKFVRERLESSGFDNFGGGTVTAYPFRSRFMHTTRVMEWAKRIREDCPKADTEMLELAVIFHDVGYSLGNNREHQKNSAMIFHQYAEDNRGRGGIWNDEKRLEKVEWIIGNHSRKEWLGAEDAPEELTILMEADMLDEEGAMRITWDNMGAAIAGAESFNDALARTLKYWNESYMPMVTPLATQFFKRKQQFVADYIGQMKFDLGIE